MNSAVCVDASHYFDRSYEEEKVDYDYEGDRTEKHRNAQPSNSLLVLENTTLFLDVASIEEKVCENGKSRH